MGYDFFHGFSPNSRIWIYQSNIRFEDNVKATISETLNQFIKDWKSHGQSVKAEWHLLHDHFILISADEGIETIGGCSIDSSVKVMKDLSNKTGLDLFNRTNIAMYDSEKNSISFNNIHNLPDLLDFSFYDNTITTIGQWRESWLKPIKGSWLENFITTNITL